MEDNFRKLEKGVVAFMQPGKDDATETACVEAVQAYQQVLLSTVPGIRAVAIQQGLSYRGRLEDEYMQEGLMGAIRVILGMGMKDDIAESCSHFYGSCLLSAKRAMWDLTQEDAYNRSGIDDEQYDLMLAAEAVEEKLTWRLQRHPTFKEIAEDMHEEPAAVELALKRKQDKSILSVEALDRPQDFLYANGYTGDDIDAAIEEAYQADMLNELFASPVLSDSQKVALSLFYRCYSPCLRGAGYGRPHEPSFVYPYAAEDFDDLVRDLPVASPIAVAEILAVQNYEIRRTVNRALHISRVFLEKAGFEL